MITLSTVDWHAVLAHPYLELAKQVYICYLLFLVYAAWKAAKDDGRKIPLAATFLISPVIAYGYVLDVLLLNTLIASITFWEKPWVEDWKLWGWTLTARLKRHKNYLDWRGFEARQVAKLLDPFQRGGHV